MNQLVLLAPEIFLSVCALGILLGEAFFPNKSKQWFLFGLVALGLAGLHQGAFFFSHAIPGASFFGIQPTLLNEGWVQYAPVFGMVAVDSLALFFKFITVVGVVMVLWLSMDYPEFKERPMGTYVSLLLLATVGMLFLVGSVDLLLAVIALELLSISSFILSGFVIERKSSIEGAIKLFLVGTFSTGILLFGISYFYGYFGSTSMDALFAYSSSGQTADLGLSVVLVFIIAGLGFKLAMVPFHMWAPDTYEGAPTPVAAFLSVAPKAAALGFLIRLLANHVSLGITPILALLAALTMTVGNLGALKQNNIKRMLAYSSIAQVGYILVAIVAGGSLGTQAAMVYMFVYLFMNLGLFSGLLILSNQNGSDDLSTFAGLASRSMGFALGLVILALSMIGIPPLGGFVGKFAIFSAVIGNSHLLWLGVVTAINSVISFYYYFKIVQQMFFREPVHTARVQLSPALMSCLVLALGITLVAGLLPNQLLGWVRNILGS
ncbi:MAG: NAD(P)H-quinone oxidoreductase subunit 2, chloroplastic [Elusimicrobia bacterium]|nr:NAD(P)H-quinone oxidoreductase subunit 2, chloroplastic [Elusimicrobiota bacterium]